ncbi:MAG TPA: alginate lyase family protein [Pyrinomonadaceae bacterium]|nr:alginate lyase family protein [Pyrinomonadaceae bacterium]
METLLHTKWRDVFCICEHAHTDLALADEVCDGVFTCAGIRLELGVPPDWTTTALPEDEEWRIEWYKFYYGLDLAHAFAVTGNEKYRETWRQLVQSWIAQMPVGCDSSDIAARRIQNWIYAWNAFSENGSFEAQFEDEIICSLATQVTHLRNNLTAERNHRTLELYALFIAALALPELNNDNLLEFAMTELHRNLLTDVKPDGVHREQSTHYHAVVLRSFLGARENAKCFDLEFPASYDERLKKACEFLLHVQRPDGLIPALSDADTGSYSDLLELAAFIFDRSDFLYVATDGALGEPPAELCASFPDGGYYIQRSGWGVDDKYLVFDCGPLGDGGHGHYDLLNIEVAANGRALIVDPGRFTYVEDDEQWRHYFKGTAGHNTVCVDDLDQTPYQRGKAKGAVAQGRLLSRVTAPDFDMLCGEVRSPVYDAVHTRRIFFIAGEYWLIVDSLRAAVPHKYELRFHLTPLATDGFVLLFEPHRKPVMSEGWVSPYYGIKEAARVISVVAEGCKDTDFYTLIVPLKPGSSAPSFQVETDRSDALSSGQVRVERVGKSCEEVDEISWTNNSVTFGRRSLS